MDNYRTDLTFKEVDEGWATARLGDVVSFSKGKGISKDDIVEEGKTECIRYGELYTTYSEVIKDVVSKTDIDENELVFSEKNDIIIPSSGETQIDIARASCVLKNGIALGGDINILKTKLNGVYLSYFLNSAKKRDIASMAQGISVVHLYASQLQNLIIHYPLSILHSTKIANCLSSLDDLIAAHSQKLELLKDHKKGLMQNLFPHPSASSGSGTVAEPVEAKVPKVRFKEFEKDGAWVEKKLGEIAENLDSKRIPITSTQREKGSIPYYGASGIIDYVKDYIFNETLLCISEDGANLIDRNYPIAFTISGKTWVNNHSHVLRFETFDTQILVEKYINSINIQDFLTGMAQPKLNRGKLDIIPIPLPNNPQEQQKIASCLSSLDALITAQAEKIEQLRLHKKGLMQGLFPKIKE